MKRRNLLTKTELKRTGWSDALIRDFYGEPKKLKKHDRYNTKIKLYDRRKVEKIQQTDEFLKAYSKTVDRREAAKKAYQTKVDQISKFIEDFDFNMPKMTDEVLHDVALFFRFQLQKAKWEQGKAKFPKRIESYADFNGSKRLFNEFVKKESVNYLWFEYSNKLSQEIESNFSGNVGISKFIDHYKVFIYEAIKKKYPSLSEEINKRINKHLYT